MTRATGNYEIGRATNTCAATGNALEPGDAIVAALVEHPESDGFMRTDFALAAWDDGARPAKPARLFGFWRTTVPEPNAKVGPVIDAEGLLGLFEQLAESDPDADTDRIALRYLITLVLVRKRELVLDRVERTADRPVLLVRPKGVAHREDPPMEVFEPAPGTDLSPILDQLGEALNLDTDGL
ncbi:MAG: hypothetical protein AAF297_02375 [Planctomycetota bacterium]